MIDASGGRMPTVYLPHGGGPWPWMDLRPVIAPVESRALAEYRAAVAKELPRRPRAVVVVSAHWEAPVPTVTTHPRPPMLFDYHGFPPEMYMIRWPAPGEPGLAARVRALLAAAGLPSGEDPRRGFDHGAFVPLKVAFPGADVPTVQLSLEEGLDPARHLAIGRALAPLRDEDVLLVGSGMSYHSVEQGFRVPRSAPGSRSQVFDAWLRRVVAADPAARDLELTRWESAPMARLAHPREEHLLPLMVVAGAAGADRGRVAYSGTFAGSTISAAQFGA